MSDGLHNKSLIKPLNALSDLEFDFLANRKLREQITLAVVTPEYYDFFVALNNRRLEKGMASFTLLVKMRSRNGENIDISSERIRNGEIRGLENCYAGIDVSCHHSAIPIKKAS